MNGTSVPVVMKAVTCSTTDKDKDARPILKQRSQLHSAVWLLVSSTQAQVALYRLLAAWCKARSQLWLDE
jgi:hypothetical protein